MVHASLRRSTHRLRGHSNELSKQIPGRIQHPNSHNSILRPVYIVRHGRQCHPVQGVLEHPVYWHRRDDLRFRHHRLRALFDPILQDWQRTKGVEKNRNHSGVVQGRRRALGLNHVAVSQLDHRSHCQFIHASSSNRRRRRGELLDARNRVRSTGMGYLLLVDLVVWSEAFKFCRFFVLFVFLFFKFSRRCKPSGALSNVQV